MVWVVKIIAILIIVMGIVFLVRPIVLRSLIQFFAKGNRIYLVGVMRFVIAILLLLSVQSCKIKWVIIAFGVLFILSGVLVFSLGPKKLAVLINWIQKQPLLILRFLGLMVSLMGGILLYSA
ncbi:MAG: hypothetical protein E4H40_01610 [Candidatus Brocadiia bacterium]|nr:MAG: hypothetical protein E4H40_01610 [Candidatus Brocadiia bacterium]